jgi:hypothetical protein
MRRCGGVTVIQKDKRFWVDAVSCMARFTRQHLHMVNSQLCNANHHTEAATQLGDATLNSWLALHETNTE